jgi:hypothetical protein
MPLNISDRIFSASERHLSRRKNFIETRQYSPHFTSDIYMLNLEAITAAPDIEAITATTITSKSM